MEQKVARTGNNGWGESTWWRVHWWREARHFGDNEDVIIVCVKILTVF